MLGNSPIPIVPAPTASDVSRKKRRLIESFRVLTLFSTFSSRGRLVEPALESLGVFMPVESQRLRLRAVLEKVTLLLPRVGRCPIAGRSGQCQTHNHCFLKTRARRS